MAYDQFTLPLSVAQLLNSQSTLVFPHAVRAASLSSFQFFFTNSFSKMPVKPLQQWCCCAESWDVYANFGGFHGLPLSVTSSVVFWLGDCLVWEPSACSGFAWCLSLWDAVPQRESTGTVVIQIFKNKFQKKQQIAPCVSCHCSVITLVTLNKHWSCRKLTAFTCFWKNVEEWILLPILCLLHRVPSLLHCPFKWWQKD